MKSGSFFLVRREKRAIRDVLFRNWDVAYANYLQN